MPGETAHEVLHGPPLRSAWSRYAAALTSSLVAMVATAVVFPRTTAAHFPFLLLGVVVASWLGGRAPGLLTLVLNVLFATYYFAAPAGVRHVDEVGTWLVLFTGAVVALLVGSLRAIIGELDKSRQSYRNANELLSLAFESAQSGSFLWDATTNENTWSPEMLALYGLRDDEMPERYEDWLECVAPEDRAVASDALRAALRSGSLSVEFRVRRRDSGEVRWLEGRGRVLFDEHEHPTRIVGINVDITHRKELEASQRRAASVPEMSPNPIVEADRDGVVRYQNPAARRLLPGLVERGLEHPWLAGWPALARRVCEGHAEKLDREVAVGDRVYHQVLVCPPGEHTVRSYALDVTARVRMEQELRRERDFTSAVVDVTSSLVVVFDASGRVVRFNRACQSATGYTEAEVLGRSFEMFIPPDERSAVDGVFHRLTAGQFPSQFENHWVTKDGATRLLAWSNTALLDDDGNVAFVVGTGVDITEARAAEEALRDGNSRKNEFLAMLSHELRNPLAPIQNSLFLLEHAATDSPQAKRAVRVIGRQVHHMTRLIDDLLDVTRIARGKVHLQRERLDLYELVRRTAEDHRPVFARLGVGFEVDVEATPTVVNGDATRLSQIIGNLLGNAAKFTPPGGLVTLTARAEGDWVEVQVRDNGVGIPPDIVETLFLPFVQANQTLDRSKGGLGLGLSLVKGLVDLHGGSVRASSDGPGRGATFSVRLPLERRRRSRVTAVTERAAAARSHRILVIEDNTDAAESLKEALELCGHIVQTAATGDEGIAKAREFSPDLVLCDIGLPGMDGYEVARTMRSDPALRGMRLIALSGYASPEDAERAHRAGFDEHVPKPTDFPMLERVLMTTPRDSRAS